MIGFARPDIVHAQAPETPQHVEAADTTQIWLVRTTDGNDFIGRVVDKRTENLVLMTLNIGQVTIPKNQIERVA